MVRKSQGVKEGGKLPLTETLVCTTLKGTHPFILPCQVHPSEIPEAECISVFFSVRRANVTHSAPMCVGFARMGPVEDS